jgi:uncharacterized protein (TIGR00299 family) protein
MTTPDQPPRAPGLLLLEPIGGIAGDMFLAAAIDLGLDAAALEAALRTLGVPGWRLVVSRRSSGGVEGTHVEVVVEGPQPHDRGLAEILAAVDASGLSPRARAGAKAVFERLGRAEAKVHRVPVESVRFHEVGAVDSIVDVCGAAVALDLLGWPRLACPPPELGHGVTRGAHGPMPVPPPAVLELLIGKPIRPGGPPGEAVTPTGAALLAEWAEVGEPPALVPERVGYGVGTRTWPDRPNVLRMTLGAPFEVPRPEEVVWTLEANLDDATGEQIARALEAALEAGALDAWAAPITMKKGRPGVLVGALAAGARREPVTSALFAETTTLGVRRYRVEREVLEREVVPLETEYGTVRVKLSRRDGRVTGVHPEYDDCLARARERGVSVRAVMTAALAAHLGR